MATAPLIQDLIQEEFSPTPGQVTFILAQAPANPTGVQFVVNGVDYDDVDDFTVSGVTVTWLDPFVLSTVDKVLIRYQ